MQHQLKYEIEVKMQKSICVVPELLVEMIFLFRNKYLIMFIPENYSELKPKKFSPKNVFAQPGFLGDERKRHKNLSVSLSIIYIKLSFGRNKIWTANIAVVELCVNSVLKNEKVVATIIVILLYCYFIFRSWAY